MFMVFDDGMLMDVVVVGNKHRMMPSYLFIFGTMLVEYD